jgi:carbamoyltransferase
MKILGISAHYHDSAAALLVDGVPVCAVQEERISRKKHDAAFPLGAIEWCLEHANVPPEELDAVVFYEKPMLKLERIVTCALRAFPRSWRAFPKAMKNTLGDKAWIKGTIASRLGVPGKKILFTEHHLAHAAVSFFTAPCTQAALLIADGVGEWATLSVGRAERKPDGQVAVDLLREVRFPHSLGMLYSTFTAFLGFEVNEGEYKVMGLASYGQPRFESSVRKLIRPTADGAFELDLSYFDYHTTAQRSFSSRFVDEFGPPRAAHEPLDPTTPEGARHADIAASVQRVLEDTLVELARSLQRETGLEDLCLGGGVALNGCANARILAESGFARVWVPSAPGDAGCALGAALYADRVYFGQPDREIPMHPYWGPSVDAAELARIVAEDGLGLDEEPSEAALIARIVRELENGAVVGWMDGAAELGPRALGNRSILAAPFSAETRDKLNRSIKYREEFRPFAPAVPVELADRFFELGPGGAALGRFMSGVFPVRPQWRARLAAVTHVDGTARLQTVDRAWSPRFHALLTAFGERTGVPILLNTSFNLAGEPIVNRAVEGYSTFRRSGIDLLVAGLGVVHKRSPTVAVDDARGAAPSPREMQGSIR